MTHAEMDDYYDLYALGVVEPEVAAEIESHLDEKCDYCLEHIRDAANVVAALANVADQVQPPRALRERVMSTVYPRKPSRNWRFAFSLLAVGWVAVIVVIFWSANRVQGLRDQVDTLRRERIELRAAVELLSRSDTRTVEFGKSETVPHGRVLVNRTGGLVFIGSQLPALAPDKTFELWLIPASGAPQPAGLFRPDQTGHSVDVASLAVPPGAKAVAVSVEPSAGSSAPTTTPILVVPLA